MPTKALSSKKEAIYEQGPEAPSCPVAKAHLRGKDELKTGALKENCPEFYIINPYTFSDWELRSTLDRNVGYHEKYMNGGNTGVFKNNSVCISTHPHENSSATSV